MFIVYYISRYINPAETSFLTIKNQKTKKTNATNNNIHNTNPKKRKPPNRRNKHNIQIFRTIPRILRNNNSCRWKTRHLNKNSMGSPKTKQKNIKHAKK